MSWTASLGDAQIGALATAASADNLVTYLEMLGLLEAAAGDGISAVEFADLQTVHANFAPLYGSDYIRSISTSVIVGNPGNAKFWGGAKALGDVAELGNMAAGLSAQKAGWLIDKWFLGRDLPMPVVGGDTANSKAASGIYSYAKATGALFVSGAAASDINQGSAGTCYLVASLGAIAGVNGALITDAVIDNANGSYGVRFYLDGAPVYVTVDQNVPVTGTNRVALSSNVEHSLSGESWVSLIEKAYAQLNAQANINNAGKWSGEASYQAVEGGWANPIKQLTNLSYRYYSSYYAGVPDNFKASEVTSTDAGTYKQTIIDGLAGGAIGWLASFGNTYDAGNSKQNLVSGHAFMLLGYDAGTDLFTVRNPWGGTGGGYNAQFTVTIGDFWNSTVKGIVALSEAGAAPPVFSYALASSAGEATPATEGDTVTLTITRSGTGAASTVYLSTTGISAGAGDFAGVNRVAVNFAAQETTASIAVKTNADTLAEDTESFRADIFVTAAETVSAASVVSHIKDQATAVFSYAATSSAPDADHAAIEGAGITYTITRSGSGSVSTIYLSTMAVTAGGADIAGLDRLTLQFAAYETVKSITIATLQDSAVEGTESFNLEFRENPDSAGTTMLAAGFIADAALPAYGYTIQSSAGSAEAAVEEGGAVSFSIHRSGTGTQSTVYVATGQGSAGNADYAALALQAVTFEAYQSVATVTVQTNQDWWLETPEYFRLDLFLQQGAASFATHGTGFIKDRPNADFNYAITNSSDAAPVAEGSSIVFTVTRSGSGAASTVYLTTTDGSAGRLDYAGLDQFALEFAAYETSKQVTIETLADAGSEEAEHFWLNLYRNIADSAQATSSQGRIADAAAPSFDYSVTSSAPEAAPVDEGGQISFTITRSGTGAASTVYVSTLDSTAGGGTDFAPVTELAVDFAAHESTKTVTVATYADASTEGDEYFWLDLYETYADSQTGAYAAFARGTIADAVVTDFSYTVSSDAGFATPASEGGSVTFTITRSGTGAASTVYVSTSDSSAWAGVDFEALPALAVNFAPYETSKSVIVATYQDSAAEGLEGFWLDLYESYADSQSGDYAAYASGYIADAAVVDFDYTVASSAGILTPASEGGVITFTITRSGTGAASTVYLSTTGSTAQDGSDFQGLAAQPLIFAANETSKTVTVATYQDNATEGVEYFWLDLFESYADSQDDTYAAFASGYIADAVVADFSYSVTSNAPAGAPASEGAGITFTITRSGAGADSVVYVRTSDATATSGIDYEDLPAQALAFATGETSKTITVPTYQDSADEGLEYFWLDLFESYADSLTDDYAAFASGYVADTSSAVFSYTVATNAGILTPVAEGGAVSFTITRNGTGAASTVYVTTTGATATAGDDFQALSAQAVSFGANDLTGTVTVNVLADATIDPGEYFWLDVFQSLTDSQAGNYAAYTSAYLTDTAPANFDYTVTSTAAATPVTEGDDVTFTITRSGTGAASTVYVTTIQATAWENIDYTGLPIVALAFAANETAKTITVHTLADEESEVAEKFWLDLYTSLGDIAGGDFLTFGTANIVDPFSAFGVQNAPPAAPANSAPLTATDVAITSFRGDRPGSFANTRAFAAIRSDRSVVTWGDAENGGDSSAVSGQLAGVVRITPNAFAFAALRADGSVVTWGNASLGGNSAPVAGALAGALAGAIDVTDVFSTMSAFAAVRRDGSVITWGDPSTGGNSASVAPSLDGTVDVTAIVSNMSAFAALRADGSVVAWGYGAFGGDSTAVAAAIDGTLDVMRLAATGSAFAAIRSDGSVVTWGNAADGGDSSAVAAALNGAIDVVGIGATASAFAAIRADGSVVTWGQNQAGGSSATVAAALDGTTGVVALAATQSAFAARREDGSVVAWGSAGSGGDLTGVAAQLDGTVDAVKILANSSAFAALRSDGSVVVWGHGPYGGDAAAVAGQLTNVVSLAATEQAFAALRADGSVVTWGSFLGGGNSADVAAQLDGTIDVVQLTGTGLAFAALRADGSVVTWGDQVQGGFSGAVASALTSVSQLTAGSNTTATADLAIAAADAVKLEGGAGATTSFTFTVTRTGNTGTAITVPYTVSPAAPRPAGAAAFSGGVLPSGTVAFAASETNATITIEVAGDAVLEGNQNFTVTLGPAPAGVAFVAATATGTILEDEAISDIIAVNGSTGNPMAIAPVFYAGPVAGLEREMILLTPENLTIALAGPNWFVHSGSGDDAIAAFGGTNVLDGGTGSNFLTGGPGADTFFVDARGATAPIWSTVNGFSTGDAATLWGVSKSSFDLNWFDGQGAPGFTNAQRTGGGLTVLFGHDPGSDSDYMYVLAN